MDHKDLQKIMDVVRKNYLDLSAGCKINGMRRSLNEKELIAMAYYKSVVDHLCSLGLILDHESVRMDFIHADSCPMEDDYE